MMTMSLRLSAAYRTINRSAYFKIVMAKKQLFENAVSVIGGPPTMLTMYFRLSDARVLQNCDGKKTIV